MVADENQIRQCLSHVASAESALQNARELLRGLIDDHEEHVTCRGDGSQSDLSHSVSAGHSDLAVRKSVCFRESNRYSRDGMAYPLTSRSGSLETMREGSPPPQALVVSPEMQAGGTEAAPADSRTPLVEPVAGTSDVRKSPRSGRQSPRSADRMAKYNASSGREFIQEMWCNLDEVASAKEGVIDQVMMASRRARHRNSKAPLRCGDGRPTIESSLVPQGMIPMGTKDFPDDFDVPYEEDVEDLEGSQRSIVFRLMPVRSRRPSILVPILLPQCKQRMLWIMIGVFCIMYECVSIPIILCFDTDPAGLFAVLQTIITIFFLLDVLVSFFTGYTTIVGDVVLDPLKIFERYLKTWFIPDIVASLPLEWWVPSGGKSVRLIRFLRLLRLARLIRLMKLKATMHSVEAHMEGNIMYRFTSRLFKLLGFLAMAMHWCACIWYLVGTVKSEEKTWTQIHLEDKNYNRVDQKYVWSLYFILTTMTTVGYGDINPETFSEAQFALFLLPTACVLFATLMGALTDLITNLNAQATKRADHRMMLSHYMHWRNVPQRLRMRIRTYMIFVWDATRDWPLYEDQLKSSISPVLREELCMHIHGKVLVKVPFLAWMQGYPICVRQLASMLHTRHIDRGDHLFQVGNPCETVYVLTSGSMWLSLNQTVHQGDDTDDIYRRDSGKSKKTKESRDKFTSCMKRTSTTLNLAPPRNGRGAYTAATDRLKETLAAPAIFSRVSKAAGARLSVVSNVHKKRTRDAKGYNIFDGDVLNDAFLQLQLHDFRVNRIVLRLQQNWRARKAKRMRHGIAPARPSTIGSNIVNMRSHMVHAPSYFGESCLWVPMVLWQDKRETPRHMYNARCDRRGELVQVERESLRIVMQRFSPWLPERFEYFREHVVKGMTAAVQEAHRREYESYAAVHSANSDWRSLSTYSLGTVKDHSQHLEVEKIAFLAQASSPKDDIETSVVDDSDVSHYHTENGLTEDDMRQNSRHFSQPNVPGDTF